MYATSGNVTNFTGVLVRRQYNPGQKYIQLVFQTAEGFRVSLSRNWQMSRSLSPGYMYQVEGQELVLGDKSYVHEPTAILVQNEIGFYERHSHLFIIATPLLLIAIMISAVFFMTYNSANNEHSVVRKINLTGQQQPVTLNANPKPTIQTQPAVTTPAPTVAAKTKKVVKTVPKSTTQPKTPAVAPVQPAAAAPAPVQDTTTPVTPSDPGTPPAPPVPDPNAPPAPDPNAPPAPDPNAPV